MLCIWMFVCVCKFYHRFSNPELCTQWEPRHFESYHNDHIREQYCFAQRHIILWNNKSDNNTIWGCAFVSIYIFHIWVLNNKIEDDMERKKTHTHTHTKFEIAFSCVCLHDSIYNRITSVSNLKKKGVNQKKIQLILLHFFQLEKTKNGKKIGLSSRLVWVYGAWQKVHCVYLLIDMECWC